MRPRLEIRLGNAIRERAELNAMQDLAFPRIDDDKSEEIRKSRIEQLAVARPDSQS